MKVERVGEWVCGYCGEPWDGPICQEHIDLINRQAEREGLGLEGLGLGSVNKGGRHEAE